jgi:hypothetical protein
MRHIKDFNLYEERINQTEIGAEEVKAIENVLDGLAGVLAEGGVEDSRYWKDLYGDIGVLMKLLRKASPAAAKRLEEYGFE